MNTTRQIDLLTLPKAFKSPGKREKKKGLTLYQFFSRYTLEHS